MKSKKTVKLIIHIKEPETSKKKHFCEGQIPELNAYILFSLEFVIEIIFKRNRWTYCVFSSFFVF